MEYINHIIQNGGKNMADGSISFFKYDDAIMTSLLVLKILCVRQLLDVIRPYYLIIFRFMPTLREIWILPIISPM